MIEERVSLELQLRRVASGDRKAFAALYASASAKLFGIVLRIVPDRALAEDVLQETFLRVWRNAGTYDQGSGRAVTWLAAIARNAAIDMVRQRQLHLARHQDSGGEDPFAGIADPAASVHPADREALRACLGRLEEEQRACVCMAYLDGYSREELAERFSRPVGTIKTLLHRGLARLRDCLENR